MSAFLLVLTVLQFPASATSTTYVSGDCRHAQVRPRSIIFACADGGWYAHHLRWTSWGPNRAVGLGVFHINDCIPDCAEGKFHTRTGSITLGERHWCKTGRRWVFAHAAITYDTPWHGHTKFPASLYCPLG